ncbi:MAG: chemotaxis protein [Actinobacillus minor]|nr:chemotaxis protein [Actinobacillus minor]
MPLPFILAGAAIAAAGIGAKKAYDGYQDSEKADNITDAAQERYENEERIFTKQDKATNESLETLGALQLQIGADFAEFKRIADPLLERLAQHRETKDLQISIPKNELDKIEGVAFSATAYLGQLAGSAAVGAGAAYAVYGGVMALAAASTGTPIAALSGAAAYNAAMAAIGGGSIAAGGFGMAGGAAILGGVVAAPIALVAGWAYASHAEKKLKGAREYSNQVQKAVDNMRLGRSHLSETEEYANKIHKELNRVYQIFGRYFQDLKNMDTLLRNGMDINTIAPALIQIIGNGYSLAAILTDVITTPLFKAKKHLTGELVKNSEGTVEFETDDNGMKIINKDEIDAHITLSTYKSKPFIA